MTTQDTARLLSPRSCAQSQPLRTARPRLWPARRHLRATAALLGLALNEAHAAGGHHAVDDAAILEPGQCEVETWFDRERGGGRTLLHVGPACRLGPVELGLNMDRARSATNSGNAGNAGNDTTVTAGPQVKWVTPVTESLSVGVVLAAGWQDSSPRFVGSTVVLPLTWQPTQSLAVHVNLGRDFRQHAKDMSRAGAALEWAATPQWSMVAERFREGQAHFWRVGARYVVSDTLSLDLSQARGLAGAAPAWWTVGFNWAFQR